MAVFLVECMGLTGPLEDVDNGPFASAVRPVKASIEKGLASDPEAFGCLKVIFFVDLERGLGFRLAGPEAVVRRAVDLVGKEAGYRPSRPN